MRSLATVKGKHALRVVERKDRTDAGPGGEGAVLLVGRFQGGLVSLAEQVMRARRALLWHACGRDAIASLQEGRVGVVLCSRTLPDGDWSLIQRALRRMRNPPPLVVVLPEEGPRPVAAGRAGGLRLEATPPPAA